MKKYLLSLFAMLAVALGAQAGDVTDVLDNAWTGVSGTSYKEVTDLDGSASEAVYSVQCAGSNSTIQLRTKNSDSGIVTTTSGGTAKTLKITWNFNTSATRTISVYGKTTAYSAPSDLYNANTQGELIGELNIDDATNDVSTLDLGSEYQYIGIRSKSGALFLDEVQITWTTAGGSTVAKPTFDPAGTSFLGSIEVTLVNPNTEGEICYTLDGSEPTYTSDVYQGPITLTETTTIKAIALDGIGTPSSVAEATYTKLETITIAQAHEAEVGTTVAVQATCAAVADGGYVLTDGVDYLYVYAPGATSEIFSSHDYVVVGEVSTYGGATQLKNPQAYDLGRTDPSYTHPEPVELTGTDIQATKDAGVAERKYVTYTGTLTISGNYYNIAVEGATDAVASIVKPLNPEYYTDLNDKKVVITGYQLYVNNKYVYSVATDITLAPTMYTITMFDGIENGTVESDKAEAAEGETVTLTVTPAEGFYCEQLIINFGDDEEELQPGETENVYTFAMPASDVQVQASFARLYTVHINDIAGGTVEASPVEGPYGTVVTLTATPDEGFEFVEVSAYYLDDNQEPLYVDMNPGTTEGIWEFTIPDADVYVDAQFNETGDIEDYWSITVEDGILNGTVETDAAEAIEGQVVLVTPIPDEGYELGDLSVYYIEQNDRVDVEVAPSEEEGVWTFTMPGNDVYVEATFNEVEQPADIAEGVYYIYHPATGKFLSRGNDWGTAAVVDNYGSAIELTKTEEGKYSFKNVDTGLYYGDDYWMYADNDINDANRMRYFTLTQVESGNYQVIGNLGMPMYVFMNENEPGNLYRVAGNGELREDGNCPDPANAEWQFITPEQRDEIVLNNNAAQVAAAMEEAGVPSLENCTEGEPIEVTFKTGSEWTVTRGNREGIFGNNDNGTELYEGCGIFSQTIYDLQPGLYKVDIQAFYRDGWNTTVAGLYDQGYNLSRSYLEANGSTVQVLSWAQDRTSDTTPDNMGEAAACFDGGSYINTTYAYVGLDGIMNLGLIVPDFTGGGWFIADNVTLTPLTYTAPAVTLAGGYSWYDQQEVSSRDELSVNFTAENIEENGYEPDLVEDFTVVYNMTVSDQEGNTWMLDSWRVGLGESVVPFDRLTNTVDGTSFSIEAGKEYTFSMNAFLEDQYSDQIAETTEALTLTVTGVAARYTIAPVENEFCDIAAPESAEEGEEVFVNIVPAEGYQLVSATAHDASGAPVAELMPINEPNTYVFTMPACDVFIEAQVEEEGVPAEFTYEYEGAMDANYEGASVGVEIDKILAAIGATEGGYTVYTEIEGERTTPIRGETDGWRNADGVFTGWSADGSSGCAYFVQDNGTDIVVGRHPALIGTAGDYTAKLVYVNNETEAEAYVYIHLTYPGAEVIDYSFSDLNVLAEDKVDIQVDLATYYQGKRADADVAAIFEALGVESLDELDIFAVQSDGTLDANYKLGATDGWRDAQGDWKGHGAEAYFYVKADFSAASTQIYEAGTIPETVNTNVDPTAPAIYTAKYAFVVKGSETHDAFVLSVVLNYGDTTGIESLIADKNGEQTIYDLSGRRVRTITKGGMYIVNGKKVFVK